MHSGRPGAGDHPAKFWNRGWPKDTLLARLTEEERRVLLGLGRLREYPAGSNLLCEGDATDFVLLILDGFVKITGSNRDGRTSLLAVRQAGDIIGELAALDGRPRAATASATGLVVTRIVRRADFDDCLRDHPTIAVAVTCVVVEKLRMATRRRVDFAARSAKGRLARVLVEMHAGETGPDDAGILFTQSELAALIGASEPTVHKCLRALREEGLIATRYRRLVVRDLTGLEELALGDA